MACAPRKSAAVVALVLGLFACPLPVLAVDPERSITQYSLSSWRERDGLLSPSVRAIAQTPDGYLWLATDGGLVRFDGVRFATFSKFNTEGMTATYLNRLTVDRRGRLLLAIDGLTCVEDGVFRSGPCDALLPGETLVPNSWEVVFEDRDGAIWLGDETGVFRVEGGRVTHYAAAQGLGGNYVSSITQDRHGTLWVGGNEGLYRFTGERFELLRPWGQEGPSGVDALGAASDGSLWVASGSRAYRLEGERVVAAVTIPSRTGGQPNVTAFREDRAGNLWIGAYQSGLHRLRGAALETLSDEHGLSSSNVTALFEDREGSLWIGTEDGGLNRLKDGEFITFLTQDGLPHNIVLCVREDRAGGLWIGTANGLVHFRAGAMKTYTTRDGLAHDHVNAVVEDAAGALWIGSNGGLTRFQGGRFKSYTTRDGLHANQVRALAAGPDGSLWIGFSASGVDRLKDGRFRHYSTREGLAHEFVRIVHADRGGAVWFTTRAGVNRFENERFTLLTTEDGLAGNVSTGFLEGDDGSFWFASPDGLTWLKDGQFRRYTGKQGEFFAVIDQILEDGEGRLWLGTARGIFSVAKADLLAYSQGRLQAIPAARYGLAHGLATVQVSTARNWPPAFKGRDGRLWFGTVKGLAMRDPRHVLVNTLAPEVRIEELRAAGDVLGARQALALSPAQRTFELHYTALSLLEPEKVRFRYRLEGYDSDFVDAGTRRVAYYTHVPPGRYRFRVIACNNSGVWNETGAALALSLAPRFHETGWFYALLGVTGLGLVRGGHELRVRRLKAREKELAAKVEAAVAQIKTLSGLLPICASCKKVRDDKGYWNQIESYVQEHTQADFTHSVCPECVARLYPDYHAARS
jgi:ligand-binding sensor domain-containing protein